MLESPRLQVLTVFNSFFFIMDINGGDKFLTTDNAADGEHFVAKIVRGENVITPGYLLFTAPYRLCEGDCKKDGNNFIMSFPLYVGKEGIKIYKNLYNRDFNKLHNNKPNAPFKRRTTKAPTTYCPTQGISKTTETKTIITTDNKVSSATDDSGDTNEDTYFPTIDTTSSTATEDVSYITNVIEIKTTPIVTYSSVSNKADITSYARCPEVIPRLCRKKTTSVDPFNSPNDNYIYKYNDNGANDQKKDMSTDYSL